MHGYAIGWLIGSGICLVAFGATGERRHFLVEAWELVCVMPLIGRVMGWW